MKANGSGGAVGAGGACTTTGAGGGGGGATYQDCTENSDAAAVLLTMRSFIRKNASTVGDFALALEAGATRATPAACIGSIVCDRSGIITTYAAQIRAVPMSSLARSEMFLNTTHLADK